jgi:hypothetical protein
MSFNCNGRRTAALALVLVLTLALGVSAERAWVANRGTFTVDVWDTTVPLATVTPITTLTVGTGPVDMASDQADASGPIRMFVACSGSSTVSVIDPNHLTVFATISADGIFGSFDTPSGIVRMPVGSIGSSMVMVDQAYTPAGYGPVGRSTIRFIDPTTNSVVDGLREISASARYNGVVFTSSGSNRRLWIGDDGDKGVVAVGLPAGGPPYGIGDTLTYGPTGIAAFIHDTASPRTFMAAPRRLATNGTSRVVVADAGSSVVTILDASFVPTGATGEPGAILGNITLPVGSGSCVDVKVIGSVAFVSSTGAPNLHRINLSTLTLLAGSLTLVPGSGGIGHTTDGTTLFVGEAGLTGSINQVDVAGWVVDAGSPFTFSGSTPFAFYSSKVSTSYPSAVVGVGTGSTRPSHGGCGLMGLEAALVLLVLRRLRRQKA